MRRRAISGLWALAVTLFLAAGCGGDDDGGSATCHCNFGDFCEEYTSACGTTDCESNGESVFASGKCPAGAKALCRCSDPVESYLIYYYDDADDFVEARDECSFFCDEGRFEEL